MEEAEARGEECSRLWLRRRRRASLAAWRRHKKKRVMPRLSRITLVAAATIYLGHEHRKGG